MAMTSIKDVARLAGVSVTTVSHVLNKTRAVNPGTQARVMAGGARRVASARSLLLAPVMA